MRKRTISRRMSFSIEWQEAIERKKIYEARKLAGLSEEDENEHSSKKEYKESDIEQEDENTHSRSGRENERGEGDPVLDELIEGKTN